MRIQHFITILLICLSYLVPLAANSIPTPAKFTGQAKKAYEAAHIAKNQIAAKKLFCYCGCDESAMHGNLLDCFKTDHGASCGTCQREMIRTDEYNKEKLPLAQIQNKIDDEFQGNYPYKDKGPNLKKYIAGKAKPAM